MPKRGRGTARAWTASDDETIIRLHGAVPAASWATIASELGGGLTANAVRLRFQRTLKFSGDEAPLGTEEMALLKRALDDVESAREKWWCVAARYAELRKGRNELRDLGKMEVKLWCGNIRKMKKPEGGGGKRAGGEAGRGAKRARVDEDTQEEDEDEDGDGDGDGDEGEDE